MIIEKTTSVFEHEYEELTETQQIFVDLFTYGYFKPSVKKLQQPIRDLRLPRPVPVPKAKVVNNLSSLSDDKSIKLECSWYPSNNLQLHLQCSHE